MVLPLVTVASLVLATSSLGCASDEAQVEVSTEVVPIDRGLADIGTTHDPLGQARDLLSKTWGLHEPATAETPDAVDIETEPPHSKGAFERLVAQLRTEPLDELAVPIHNLAHADAAVWPQVKETLLGPRAGSKTQFKSILRLIGGDVPNRYGHFALSWKRAHGYKVKLSEDWFADLQAIASGQISGPMRKVYRDALLTVALSHAAARIARVQPELAGDVTNTLLDLAYETGGTFRDEVGRVIVSIGDEAVPHLVLASVEPRGKREDHPDRLRARYATHNLDRLDRLAPGAALEAASTDPRRLTQLLQAYGVAKPGDAAQPLLAHVDHDDPGVRAAAETSFRAYVEGPPPRMRVKMVRRLGGKVVKRQAQLSYRALATLAIRERVALELPEQLEPECEVRRENGDYDQRCLDQPSRLTDLLLTHLHTRREHAHRQGIETALADLQSKPQDAERRLDTLLLNGLEQPGSSDSESAEATRLAVVDFYTRRAAAQSTPLERASRLRKAAAHASQHESTRLSGVALAYEAQAEGLTQDGRTMLRAKAKAAGAEVAALSTGGPDAQPAQPGPHRSRMGWAFALALIALGALSWLGARRHDAGPGAQLS